MNDDIRLGRFEGREKKSSLLPIAYFWLGYLVGVLSFILVWRCS